MESSEDSVRSLFGQLDERFKSDGMVGVPTGVPSLDYAGDLLAGDLVVLAGNPGVGKTALAISIALHAGEKNQNVPVLYIALAETGGQIGERALLHGGSVKNVALRTGQLRREDMIELTYAAAALGRVPMHIEDALDFNAIKVRKLISQWRVEKTKSRHALVVVDYVQLLNGEPNGSTRDEELAGALRVLQSAAKESSACILLVSQLNRRGANRADPRPQLVDLRESGALEGAATAVLFVHPGVDELPLEVILAKHRRFSAPHTDDFNFDAATGTFRLVSQIQ
jgi:replicative DNA helicase